MTTTELVQAAIDRLAALRNAAGESLQIMQDAVTGAVTAAGGGRVVVAPGQTIGSGWGNSVWDQSVNGFTSAADRDNQWPSPQAGAMCYLQDLKVWMGYLPGIGWVQIGPRAQSWSGTVLKGAAYAATKPINRLAFRVIGTGDANGYTVPATHPAGVTSVLGVVIGTALSANMFAIYRSDQSDLTRTVLQCRALSTGAFLASTAYDLTAEVLYQV